MVYASGYAEMRSPSRVSGERIVLLVVGGVVFPGPPSSPRGRDRPGS